MAARCSNRSDRTAIQSAALSKALALATPAAADPVTAAELSPPQRIAIEKLTAGDTVVDAARAAGVSRMTLHRWLTQDSHFAAAYNAWQQELLATARGRLLALTDDAVSALTGAIRSGDSRAAITILKSMGLLDRPTPGPTDPAIIEHDRQIQAARDGERRARESLGL